MLTFKTDSGELIASLNLKTRQIPFATSKAINEVGKNAQQAVREDFQKNVRYHNERLTFELNRIKITHFATSKELTLTLAISGHNGHRAANLERLVLGEDHLGWFEFNGRKYQWLPNSLVFDNKIITTNNPLHPSKLKFTLRQSRFGPGHAGEWQGNERTFALPRRDGPNGGTGASNGMPQIWQRVASSNARKSGSKGVFKGKAKEDRFRNTRMIYTLLSKERTPVKLNFYEPIHKTVSETWVQAMRNALDYTVRPAV